MLHILWGICAQQVQFQQYQPLLAYPGELGVAFCFSCIITSGGRDGEGGREGGGGKDGEGERDGKGGRDGMGREGGREKFER